MARHECLNRNCGFCRRHYWLYQLGGDYFPSGGRCRRITGTNQLLAMGARPWHGGDLTGPIVTLSHAVAYCMVYSRRGLLSDELTAGIPSARGYRRLSIFGAVNYRVRRHRHVRSA